MKKDIFYYVSKHKEVFFKKNIQDRKSLALSTAGIAERNELGKSQDERYRVELSDLSSI